MAAARSGSNDIVLPQLAMAYELTDNQVLRLSYGKSMGRPSLQDLRSSFQFGNRDYLIPTASGGNPGLEPLESENLDIAYEYYYDEGSYFSLNYVEYGDIIGGKEYDAETRGTYFVAKI